MDILKTIWPTPFNVKEKDITSFIIQLIIFVVVCAIAGVVIGFLSALPFIGFIFGIVGGLVGLYGFVGIVLCVVNFLGLIQ